MLAAEGGTIEISPGTDSINPFDLDDGQLVPDPARAQVMANIISAMLVGPTGDQISLIPHAIAQTFEL